MSTTTQLQKSQRYSSQALKKSHKRKNIYDFKHCHCLKQKRLSKFEKMECCLRKVFQLNINKKINQLKKCNRSQ